jgi:subfamily B ATP-binding cassette protein MsbA
MVYLGLAIYSDWQLTLVILLVGPLFVIIFQVSGKKVKANQSQVQEGRAELTHNLSEGLSAHKVTKAFNLQDFVMSRYTKAQDYYFDFTMRTSKVEEIAHPFVELVGAVAF